MTRYGHYTSTRTLKFAKNLFTCRDGQPHAGVTDFSVNGITVKKQMLFNFGDNIHKLVSNLLVNAQIRITKKMQ